MDKTVFKTVKQSSGKLEDISVNVKIKLAGLWASLMFCYIYGDYFELYVPFKLETMIHQQTDLNTPVKLFAGSVLLVLPALMIFLSLIIKARLNRFINIILGGFYTVVMIAAASTSFVPWMAFYLFLAMVEVLLSLSIVRYAWRWPLKVEGTG